MLTFTGAHAGAKEFIARPGEIAGRIGLTLLSPGDYHFNSARAPQPEFEQRPADLNIPADTYDRFESALLIFQPHEYLDAVIETIELPQLPQSLQGVRLAALFLFGMLDRHLIVHSDEVVTNAFQSDVWPSTLSFFC